MYQCFKKLVTYTKYSCFDYFDFLAHSVFKFDVCWDSLGILGNSSSATINTQYGTHSRLSFRFVWLWSKLKVSFNISSLVAFENENKGFMFDLFLFTSPILSMLGWFLYFKITLRIGSETSSTRGSLWALYPRISSFLQCLKRKISTILQFCYLQKLFYHFQLRRFAPLKLSCPKEKVPLFFKTFCYD